MSYENKRNSWKETKQVLKMTSFTKCKNAVSKKETSNFTSTKIVSQGMKQQYLTKYSKCEKEQGCHR